MTDATDSESPEDALERGIEEAEQVYEAAAALAPGEQVIARVERTGLPGHPMHTLTWTVEEIDRDGGPDYVEEALELHATDEDDTQWRLRSIRPTPVDGQTAFSTNVYKDGHWSAPSGVVRELVAVESDE
jgi:hypothetical protein